MNVMRCAALCVIAVAAGAAAAQTTVPEPTELVNAQHCMFCHTLDMTFLGPSFHEIAERYRGDPHAAAELERKLRRRRPCALGRHADAVRRRSRRAAVSRRRASARAMGVEPVIGARRFRSCRPS